MSISTSGLLKREFVAPPEAGQFLIWPASDLTEIWNRNLQVVEENRQKQLGASPLGQWILDARRSMLDLAMKHVAVYADLDVGRPLSDDIGKILMAGHQPELFHPGVWFKNFVLNQWGVRFSAIPINLIIDNDLADLPRIQVPQSVDTKPDLASLFFDQSGGAKPFEESWILDSNQFQNFSDRVRESIAPYVSPSLIDPLWSETRVAFQRLAQTDPNGNVKIGEVIAAGRHRLELKNGFRTLELPLSRLADEKPFAEFASIVISRAAEFLELHNKGLAEYRSVNGLRSKTHPFPQLEKRDAWIEVPFWVWSEASPKRNRLFVTQSQGQIRLSDFDRVDYALSEANFANEVHALRDEGIKLRPRALMTTMYSRLLLSDLFIHGIGGGKYDSLTDWVAERFFDLRLPDYCVASATFNLPLKQRTVKESDLLNIDQQLRQMVTHPEKFLLDPNSSIPLSTEIQSTIDRKRELISGQFSGSGRERHQAITECNERLRHALIPLQQELSERLKIIADEVAANKVLASREFSFCLFGTDLIQRLQNC